MLNVDIRAQALLGEIKKARRFGVEVGVYTGQLSCRLLAGDPTLHLFLVDPWRPIAEDAYGETDDFIRRMTQDDHNKAMLKTLQSVKPYEDRVVIMRDLSVDAAKRFEDGSLDFVFIDGDHSYEGCKTDIAAWWPKVRAGGFLSGHDYRDDKNFGVKQAVHEWIGERELRLGGNYTWYVSKWA